MRKLIIKYLKITAVLFLLSTGLILGLDRYVTLSAESDVQLDVNKLNEKPVALLLGTCKYLRNGENPFYWNRVHAAADLYFSGKIKAILVSGDNSRVDYNEPQMMKEDLLALGVPEQAITLDYAGFSTLDSVVRAKKILCCKTRVSHVLLKVGQTMGTQTTTGTIWNG